MKLGFYKQFQALKYIKSKNIDFRDIDNMECRTRYSMFNRLL